MHNRTKALDAAASVKATADNERKTNMGIAAYNRGSRAISEQITQQLKAHRQRDLQREQKPRVNWFKAAVQSRLDREDLQFRIEDNARREQYGLPTYEI